MPAVNLTTYRDLTEHLLDWMGANPGGDASRDARRAAIAGLACLARSSLWSYYITRGRVATVAPVIGTGSYNSTTRTFTLDSGTFPSWAQYGTLILPAINLVNATTASIAYQVVSNPTSTTLILSTNSNPGADLASGTTFTLYRDTYPLPIDCTSIERAMLVGYATFLEFEHPGQWLLRQQIYRGPALPRFYCVPTDHEILTRRGWKKHKELILNEDVLTFQNDTNSLRWEPLEAIHTFPFDGELLAIEREIKGRMVKQFLFTEDHRWPVRCRSGLRKMLPAHDLSGATFLQEIGDFQGTDSILDERYAAILGWIITDGYGLWRKDHWNTRVYQSEKKYLKEILALLGTRPRASGEKGAGVFAVPVAKADRAYLRKVCPNRENLPRIACQLSRQAAEAMWQAMFMAEGWVSPKGQQGFAQYHPNNQVVIETFQILSILTGRAANINVGADGRMSCTVSKGRGLNPMKAGGVKRRPYTGQVWCPQTRSGTWVMRHNGHVVFTGNTVRGDSDYMGVMSMSFFPAPDNSYEVEFMYNRQPRQLKTEAYSTGKVSVTSGSATLTGSGTSWNSGLHTGCIVRLSPDGTNLPTSDVGSNPAVLERVVLSVGGTGTITLDQPADASYSSVKYILSDPADIEPLAMKLALLRACEYQLGVSRNRRDRDVLENEFLKELIRAREADSRNFSQQSPRSYRPFPTRLADFPRGADA